MAMFFLTNKDPVDWKNTKQVDNVHRLEIPNGKAEAEKIAQLYSGISEDYSDGPERKRQIPSKVTSVPGRETEPESDVPANVQRRTDNPLPDVPMDVPTEEGTE
jgi:hypothetical protein